MELHPLLSRSPVFSVIQWVELMQKLETSEEISRHLCYIGNMFCPSDLCEKWEIFVLQGKISYRSERKLPLENTVVTSRSTTCVLTPEWEQTKRGTSPAGFMDFWRQLGTGWGYVARGSKDPSLHLGEKSTWTIFSLKDTVDRSSPISRGSWLLTNLEI